MTPAADSNLIGRRVRRIRATRGLSLRAAAGLAGFSSSYLHHIETGKRPLERVSTIQALAQALGVAPSELTEDAPGGYLVQFLLTEPGVLDTVRLRHRADESGHCRACPSVPGDRKRHPCYVRDAADQAAVLRGRMAADRAS